MNGLCEAPARPAGPLRDGRTAPSLRCADLRPDPIARRAFAPSPVLSPLRQATGLGTADTSLRIGLHRARLRCRPLTPALLNVRIIRPALDPKSSDFSPQCALSAPCSAPLLVWGPSLCMLTRVNLLTLRMPSVRQSSSPAAARKR